MPNSRLPVFDKFIDELRAIWAEDADDGRRTAKAKPLLEQLVKDPGLKAHSTAWCGCRGGPAAFTITPTPGCSTGCWTAPKASNGSTGSMMAAVRAMPRS